MSVTVSVLPGPRGWESRAQTALDQLSTASTTQEVERLFGTARHLTELVLGFPVAGGHATRAAIRAVGRLVRHELGPAVAAEALTWSASVVGLVDSPTIEAFLEVACEASGTYRPWRLDDRSTLFERLRRIDCLSTRREALFESWKVSRSNLADPDRDHLRHSTKGLIDTWSSDAAPQDLAQWLAEATWTHPALEPVSLTELGAQQQLELVEAATSAEIDRLACNDRLFSFDNSVIRVCLLRATRSVLLNKSCSPALRERIRYPYDAATLELALRAGSDFFEQARMRRMLAELDVERLTHLLSSVPAQLLENLRTFGLLTADDLVDGRLRHLDLSDRKVARAVFGEALSTTSVRLFAETVRRHPQSSTILWLLDDAPRGLLPADGARQLIDLGPSKAAAAAMRHLPLGRLRPSDANCASECGDAWLASCPGVPAAQRPPLTLDLLPRRQAYAHGPDTPIWYPPAVLQLDGARFPEAPDWRVSLPLTVADIERNARIMRNCTAHLVGKILEGCEFLVIVHDREGHRYNVAILSYGDRLAVGQVNSWANGGGEPSWIRAAFQSRLDQEGEFPLWEESLRARRIPTVHRDRRRASARSARRLKR
jgi:hypothetical protein